MIFHCYVLRDERLRASLLFLVNLQPTSLNTGLIDFSQLMHIFPSV
jgi:hypothetical protein